MATAHRRLGGWFCNLAYPSAESLRRCVQYIYSSSFSSVKIVVNLSLIHHIDTAQNLPSTYKRIIGGFNSHSNGVKLYNEMLSRVKFGRLNDALTSEGPWERCFDSSARSLRRAICELGREFKDGERNEALLEATVLKSKLTQVAVDSGLLFRLLFELLFSLISSPTSSSYCLNFCVHMFRPICN